MTNELEQLRAALAQRYHVEHELGRGGMATVCLARDLRHDRLVALKVLKPELAVALGAERFLREVRITARLNHPHVLPLLDSGGEQGFLYYVMPYVEGESLRERLTRERQLALDDAIQITREVADALGYAHSHDVVHRDIKPENILFQSGHAVVADFGIARAITAAGGEQLTATGMAVGTPAYMSPEQSAGDQTVDGRADIYSLGCVAYEMLGGAPPFTGPSAQAVMARHAMDPVPSLRTIRPSLSPDVDRILAKALAKVPADRFHTAGEFAEALQRTGGASVEPAAQVSHPPRPWLRPGLVGAVTVSLALAAIALPSARAWLAEVVLSTVHRIRVALTPGAVAPSASTHVIDPEAYELYMQGRTHWDRLGDREQTIALQYFQRALEEDPDYALAYVGVGMVWAGRAQMGFLPAREAHPKAKEAALRALALDETLAEAHDLQGTILAWYDWDWSAAEKEFQRAMQLNPQYANAHYFYSILLAATGHRREGMVEMRRAVELDPLNRRFQIGLAWHLLNSGQYDEAIAQLQETGRLHPGAESRMLADAFRKKGMFREALDATKRTAEQDPELLTALERGSAHGGYPEALRSAADVLAARARRQYVAPTRIATLYAAAGAISQALRWLEVGFQVGDPQMVFLGWESIWDDLRSDTTFQAILRRMNLPPTPMP